MNSWECDSCGGLSPFGGICECGGNLYPVEFDDDDDYDE